MTKFLLKTQKTLISQIKEKYGDLLDCSLIEYKGTHKNIKLKMGGNIIIYLLIMKN